MAKKNWFAGSRLPPGFRFHPTDVELIMYYLKRKVLGKKILHPHAVSEVDIYKYPPWDLQHKSCWRGGDLNWYFFCPAEKKYSNGGRMKRSTDLGYWKTTGNDRSIRYNKDIVGMIKTLVFHRGKAPKGTRTDWVMYEYRLEDKKMANEGIVQDSYVLCKLFEKDGPGPKNGAQYGAPFREEDWENDDEDDDDDEELRVEGLNGGKVVSSVDFAAHTSVVPCSQSISEVVEGTNGGEIACSSGYPLPVIASSSVKPGGVSSTGFFGTVSGIPDKPISSVKDMPDNICTTPFPPCPSPTLPPIDEHVAEVSDIDQALLEPQAGSFDDEFERMLAPFFDGDADELNNGGIAEADQSTGGVDVHGGLRTTEVHPPVDGVDIFSGLGDLSNPFGFSIGPADMRSCFGNNGDFLELRDFTDPMDCQPNLWN